MRNPSPALKRIIEDLERRERENPVVKEWEETPQIITTKEHIIELQDILVQTTIDYVKKNNLTDIDTIRFSFDGTQYSVQVGEWVCFSDSTIELYGTKNLIRERKNGDQDKIPMTYKIGESF